MQGIRFVIPLVLVSLLLIGCGIDAEKVQIPPYELVHDNSSKVWLLKHQYINGKETIPKNRDDRWVLVCYRDNTFVISDLKDFGKFSLHQGRFIISDDASQLNFYWENGEVFEHQLVDVTHARLRFSIQRGDQLIEYVYGTMDKRIKKYDAINEKEYEVSMHY